MVSQRDWASPPTFEPLQGRLQDAADGPHPFTGHQKLGVQYTPDVCSLPLQTRATCITGSGDEKAPSADGIPNRAADPFVIYTWIDCGIVGTGIDELRDRTRRAHENNAPTVAETVFWTGGDFTTSQFLAANDADVVTESVGGSVVNLQTAATVITGTYDVVEAVGILEQRMADCYGGAPMIHVPRQATAHLATNMLIKEKGPRLFTIGNNSSVVAAPGYRFTGPDGTEAPAGHAWFYATGRVKMWRSELEFTARDVREFLGRSINDTVLIGEQRFMFGWDCCHFAILVSLGGIITGAVASAT